MEQAAAAVARARARVARQTHSGRAQHWRLGTPQRAQTPQRCAAAAAKQRWCLRRRDHRWAPAQHRSSTAAGDKKRLKRPRHHCKQPARRSYS